MGIPATKPVSTQAVPAITYDQWYLTQLVLKGGPTAAPTIVTLTRAAQLPDGSWVLMPPAQNSSVTFNLDVLADIKAGDATMAAAMASVLAAVTSYATSKKLL